MPFGLATAPATFQRAMELALAGLTYSICLCYLDDIIIFSNSITEHCNRLKEVLTRFRQDDLRLNLAKCTFAAKKVHYLGHKLLKPSVLFTVPRYVTDITDLTELWHRNKNSYRRYSHKRLRPHLHIFACLQFKF
jgi:hypothetical protein